jgi:pimeloyl-ACP methyl ester carboxylesterase
MASESSKLTLTLRDGRTLGYASYGTQTPTAPAIFYFHGFPASRLEGASWSPIAASLSALLIAADRPGCGLSTFQPARRILDWPSDILELADHLQISQFYVLGTSGGAPYVLACAKEIPRSRLLGAAVVSGIYPLKLGTEGMLAKSRIMMFVAAWATSLLAPLLDWQLGKVARDPDPKLLEDLFTKEMSGLPEPDRKCIENEQFRKELVESLRECFKKGSQGAVWEARLYGCDWGFELEEVQAEGLSLWHGRLDVNCPCSMPENAVKQMQGAELKVFEEEAHISLPANHAEEILSYLLRAQK